MADLSAPIPFDDIPLEDARRMGRGPRMEPLLYETLRTTIQALSTDAMRIHLGPEIRPARMKTDLLRIARDLHIPVSVRKVPGGLLFWRSTDEDRHQAQETASRLQTGRHTNTTAAQRPLGQRNRPRR